MKTLIAIDANPATAHAPTRPLLRASLGPVVTLALLLLSGPALRGQEVRPATPTVVVAQTAGGVRFTAPGAVTWMRLEVFTQGGEKIYDSDFRRGSVLDWPTPGGQGAAPAGESYLCVVTIRDAAGRLSRRAGLASFAGGRAAVAPARPERATPAQQQALLNSRRTQAIAGGAPAEEAPESLPALAEAAAMALTVASHDGKDGQVTSTAGDLTLRTGDLLTGKDEEWVRITSDGKVGIGTQKPEATLDVAGSVRASDGFQFADGSRLAVDDRGALVRTSAGGDPLPTFGAAVSAAAASANRLAKFTDGAGTLGESSVFETGGFVGVGTTAPEGTLHVESPNTTVFKVVSTGAVNTGRAVFQMYRGAAANANGWDFGYNVDLSTENFIVRELTNGAGQERLSIRKGTGNVGIGTSSPQARLDVAGAVNAAQYNVGGKRVLSVAGADNVFAGAGAGQGNTTGDSNAFFGSNAGFANTTGFFNAFFGAGAGEQNTTGSNNAFFGGTAGFFNSTGEGNAFFGREAGFGNSQGSNNSFFGFAAGRNSQTGSHNSFFGRGAGQGNNKGENNSFFGSGAGAFNNTGIDNSYFGREAGFSNFAGNFNSFFGSFAGRANDGGTGNTFVGSSAGFENTTGAANVFFDINAGRFNTTGAAGVFVGANAGLSNTTESNNTFVGNAANGSPGIANATALGANAKVTQSNSVVLGNDASVGIGTTAPKARLDVRGGNLLVGSPGQGIVLRSPNGGTCRLLTVNDSGSLVVTPVSCP